MEGIRSQKKARAGVKANITRLSNGITALMSSGRNEEVIEEVKSKLTKIEEAQVELRRVHEQLDGLLTEDWEKEEAEAYLYSVVQRSDEAVNEAARWLQNADCGEIAVDPGDSVSECGTGSSSTSSRNRNSAKKSTLEIELETLTKIQQLEARELQIKQEKELLLLKTRLAISGTEPATQDKDHESEITFPSVSRKRNDRELTPDNTDHESIPTTRLNPLAPEWIDDQPVTRPGADPSVLQFIEEGQRQQRRLLEVIQLPRAELSMFDGDPLQFWVFFRSFENTVGNSSLDENSKLTRLLQFCTGKAKNVIQCCSVMSPDEGYTKAMRLLKERFGNEYVIAEAWLKKVTEGPNIGTHDNKSLRDFADDLKGCRETLKAMGYEGELNSQGKIVSIVDRLPYYLKGRWVRHVREIRRRTNRPPTIESLVSFVDDAAEEANDPIYGRLTNPRDNKTTSKGNLNRPANRATGFSSNTEERDNIDCPICNVRHSLFSCATFKAKRSDERIKIVRQAKLCFNCLRPGHFSSSCTLRRTCSVPGCGKRHTKFLHPIKATNVTVTCESGETPQVSQQSSESQATGVTCNVTGAGAKRVALPIVAVKVRSRGTRETVDTYALLDNGATSSFCTGRLAKMLGQRGQRSTMSLTTLESKDSRVETSMISLEVSGRDGKHTVEIPLVYTKARLNINSHNMATKSDVNSWPHLADLDLPEVNTDDVNLLIGLNAPEALVPLEVRTGNIGDPYAVRTKLGWAIHGPLGDTNSHSAMVNFIQGDNSLECQLQRFWKLDTSASLRQDEKMSFNDNRAVSIWEKSIVKRDGHYEVAIPFKDEAPSLPDNLEMARARLKSLKRRLENDPELRSRYRDEMHEMFEAGHAEPVDEDGLGRRDGKVWYLPHHPVYHPAKPEKLRIVFDCAATHRSTSLNEHVLQGPDLTNKLLGVLLRFRREPVALMADIKGMFHQVRVPEDDRDVMRFLWWPDGDFNQPSAVYRMAVHLFGGKWSPSCASFALRHSAVANGGSVNSRTVKAVLDHFYVDDCLVTEETEDAAISLAKELRALLDMGGFKLTKFVSNSPRVIESIPYENRAKDVKDLDFNYEAMPTERALGVTWDIELDSFTYKIKPKVKPHTRRGLLSVVSSMYDPLGYASPVTLRAKLLIQETSRRKLGWDDPLPNDILNDWLMWQCDISKLEGLKIDRCMKPYDFGKVATCELHHFSDASEVAYGTTSYIRLTNDKGDIHTSLLMAKSRLAPLKTMTIPRLELTAATLSVEMDAMLRKELGIPLKGSVFWTDSTLVLQYIRNDDKRFHTFVANRVASIRDGSEPSQWRHVRSEQNPADDVSRGLRADEISTNPRWLHGPEYLHMDPSNWPEDRALKDIAHDDAEVKLPKESVQSCAINSEVNALGRLFEKQSSWYGLRRNIAWILRIRAWLWAKVQGCTLPDMKCPLSVKELISSEKAICLYVQELVFPDEITKLREIERDNEGDARAHILRSSPLCRLSPILNKDGLICVGGRLRNSPISNEARYPLILPRKHRVVDLIVSEAHIRSGHSGREYVLSLLSEKYWLIGARQAVRKAARDCATCKRLLAPPMEQKMGDLPVDRVTPGKPPFTYVGIDYFGPFLVKRGRSRVKRYGCIFTCLTIRAIHIEIANSLDTDSFINALQRFMCRRGQPELIRSDNGTNFVGAERELRKVLTDWNQGVIHDFLLQREIRWKFNPPSASHMGGAWERQIRTVRKTMNSLCKEQVLDDEGLSTLMCLAESIVNGRPITIVSRDPNDSEPLTPNHLLLLKGGSVAPCDKFDKNDNFGRKRWRQVHYLASVFWRRWSREYLPTLQMRHKWIEPVKNIAVGDIVLVIDENLPRNVWLMGKVLEVYYGTDNLARSAKVKTKTNTLVRPIRKMCLMESVERAEGLD